MVVHPKNKVSKLSTAETKDSVDSVLGLHADRRFCTLCDMMKIQAIVLVFYGFAFFVAPNIFFISNLGFTDPLPSLWLRALGIALVLAGALELSIISKLRRQTSRVWVFMAMPLIFIACTGIERIFGNYQSISLFLWVFEFSMLFLCLVTFISFLRLRADAVSAEAELLHVASDKAKLEVLKMKKYKAAKAKRREKAKRESLEELKQQEVRHADARQMTKTDPALQI